MVITLFSISLLSCVPWIIYLRWYIFDFQNYWKAIPAMLDPSKPNHDLVAIGFQVRYLVIYEPESVAWPQEEISSTCVIPGCSSPQSTDHEPTCQILQLTPVWENEEDLLSGDRVWETTVFCSQPEVVYIVATYSDNWSVSYSRGMEIAVLDHEYLRF